MSAPAAHQAALFALQWQSYAGDPGRAGWLTVAGYAGVAVLAGRCAVTPRRSRAGRDARFWWTVCAAMVLLGLNKQLDLQILLTDLGRMWAQDHGWYGARRLIQKEFIAGVAIFALAMIGAGLALTRRRAPAVRLAFLGLALLIGYIVVRAASFHHVDVVLGHSLLGLRWSWLIEWAGIATVGWAAWRYRRG